MNLEPTLSGALEVSLRLPKLTPHTELPLRTEANLRLIDLKCHEPSLCSALELVDRALLNPHLESLVACSIRNRFSTRLRKSEQEEWRRKVINNADLIATRIVDVVREQLQSGEVRQKLDSVVQAVGGEAQALACIDLERLIDSTKTVSRAIRGAMFEGSPAVESKLTTMVAPVATDLAGALRVVLELSGATPPGPRIAERIAAALGVPWISSLARTRPLTFEDLTLIMKISTLPEPLASRSRGDADLFLHDRLKGTLAGILLESPSSSVRETSVALISELLSIPGTMWHRFRADNDHAWLSRLIRGVERGRLELRFVSCPDYSGSWSEDGSRFQYDFARLGTECGTVAERGIPWVSGWANALKKYIPGLTLIHVEATFEVERGFVGRDEQLNREEARARIAQSGARIAERISRETGIECQTLPFDGFKSPQAQELERGGWTHTLRGFSGDSPVGRLIREVGVARASLYSKLGGQYDNLDALIQGALIPQLAEYLTVSTTLTERDDVVMLAYDSSWMHEVTAAFGFPCVFGHRVGCQYVGA